MSHTPVTCCQLCQIEVAQLPNKHGRSHGYGVGMGRAEAVGREGEEFTLAFKRDRKWTYLRDGFRLGVCHWGC